MVSLNARLMGEALRIGKGKKRRRGELQHRRACSGKKGGEGEVVEKKED